MQYRQTDAIAVLERTPALLRCWLTGLPTPWVERNEGPRTFSPVGVVGHLIEGERLDWLPRTRTILESGEAEVFAPFDRWAHENAKRDRTLAELIDEFAALRAENLQALRDLQLSETQLQWTGTHPEFGRVRLRELLATWVVHDLSHVAQIARVMAHRYRDAVGPWQECLPLLRSKRP